ncbi:MAG: IS630 family transposase [Solirubrobacteraceae bacterium]
MVAEWCLPRAADAAFVAALEDVLDLYARPPDPARPLVCFDESSKALQGHTRPPLPAAPGHPERIDSEYARHGSAALSLWTAPHLGTRGLLVTAQRRREEWALAMRHLVEEVFPAAERIVLVLDNLNTHTAASLYHTFPPDVARRLWTKLELHYTPKHGSWLNIAECEFSALKRQCLDRRLPDPETLRREVTAWAADRNARQTGVVWHFTTADARTKLHRLYPEPIYDK